MNLDGDPQLPLGCFGYELRIQMHAAMAHAEIERMAHEARCHVNHVFGGLISWNLRRFERIAWERHTRPASLSDPGVQVAELEAFRRAAEWTTARIEAIARAR